MKTSFTFITTLLLSLFLISESHAQGGKDKQVKGSGNITTKTIKTEDYDKIDAVGSMDFILEKGTEGTITVTTDDNLQEYVKITSGGGVLKVTLENYINYNSKHGIIITIPFEEISEASLTGSGDLIGKDVIKTSSFTTNLTGSGDVVLALDAENIDSKLIGSGDITLSGNTNSLEASVKGSGDFEGKNLEANNTDVSVIGSGDATVTAKKSIRARVNGSGDIKYSGSPEKSEIKSSGSGTIKGM